MEVPRSLHGAAGYLDLTGKQAQEITHLVDLVFVNPKIDDNGTIELQEKSSGKVVKISSADLLSQVEDRNMGVQIGDNYQKLKSVNDNLRRKMMTEINDLEKVPLTDLKIDKLVSLHNRMNKQMTLKGESEEKMYFFVKSPFIQQLILNKANDDLDSFKRLGNFKHRAISFLTSVKEQLKGLEINAIGEKTFAADVQHILEEIDRQLPAESEVSSPKPEQKTEKREPLHLDTYAGYHRQLSSAQLKEKFEGTESGSWLLRLDSKGTDYLVSCDCSLA